MQTITEAAYDLGAHGILLDPTDEEIVLAAVEQALRRWPDGFTIDRHFAERIVDEYGKGEADRA
jgi:AmiR/NasT family two-component response regulator